jgi:hypothetical protein
MPRGLTLADWDHSNPDPWLALMMDRSLPIDPAAKLALVRDQRSRSRQFMLPLVRPFARLAIIVAQLIHTVSPRWPYALRFLHNNVAFGMRWFLTADAKRLILRQFHLGARILRFIADNATPGFRPKLWPMQPRTIADVRDDLFLRHDLNIYNFLIALNAELDRPGTAGGRAEPLDFSSIEDEVALDPLPAGRGNVIDLQTAIELYTPAYAMLLTDRDFSRATNSLQLDETIGLYVARLTGEDEHLAMVANGHPLVSHSTLHADFWLVRHGLSTELLHGFLRGLKAKDAATKDAKMTGVSA